MVRKPCAIAQHDAKPNCLAEGNPSWGANRQRSTSGIDEETVLKTAAPDKASRVRFSGAPPFFILRSSTAEQPADNRQTVERHHAEGPFSIFAGWLRQMSGGPKTRRGWRDTNSSDHFMQSSFGLQPETESVRAKAQHYFQIASLM